MLADLDRRLQYGPGMRVQRMAEGALLVAAFFATDLRFAYAALGLIALQVVSPRLVPVALFASAFVRPKERHRLGDLYFDFAGTRGACAVSVCVMTTALWLVHSGHEVIGWALLAAPTASLVLAPSVGFCCGCAIYVGLRGVLARAGLAERYANGACDIDVDAIDPEGSKASGRQ